MATLRATGYSGNSNNYNLLISRDRELNMQDYTKLCKELIEDHIKDVQGWDDTKTRKEILNDLYDDTQNVFGNLDGSRTCNTYEAQQFIDKSGAIWDEEILALFSDIGDDYFLETLKRGAETLDVVILELLSGYVIGEMLEATK